ncbi:(+)-pulegone reductase [Dendrobium catenatum]|uniref:(+)-pulegone reductase n=1 Tax=Dendrobium catenatum TaxID=906689 RepID=A0A2I0VR42_9ASPA|nr:(+)-pulegone reductase [Dendrobium catenatum]
MEEACGLWRFAGEEVSKASMGPVPAKHLLPVPRPDAEVVSMLTSGLTASIALEKAGKLSSGEVVLVTAAAGGTGQFAVQVLKNEFPKGVDIIYESVGGDMFNLCLNALAVYGRLVVIGMVSQAGFFLNHYSRFWNEHINRLFDLYSSGKLKVAVDPRKFLGLAAVADAVEHLHSGQSLGKVVVCMDPAFAQQAARL